ncbi:phage tail sheath family protein [Streptomyces kronopolitis]|uniref:phage tail sheath family protein n=1 Tax=Streptomyces kronopolitis TaxID=1612435 RepID=UPI0020C17180|nr:phage tail sheath subtilisin-like domain-containing protein [Streptomyces kronopolitis]MCL6302582.1 phage tail sheath subtilisin-like domain-containing protein [Streptomyces kronopolitis]
MPNYLSPGVFVEEMESGSRPFVGVGTAVAAFVGFAEQGPLNAPLRISNWSQYVSVFGDFAEGCYLGHSVYGFFANGGGTCYVVRVGDPAGGGKGSNAEGVDAAQSRALGPGHQLGSFRFAALPSAAGRDVTIDVQRASDSDTTSRTRRQSAAKAGKGAEGGETAPETEAKDGDGSYRLSVKIGGAVVESFSVSTNPSSERYVVTQVRERSKLLVVEDVPTDMGAALALPEKQSLVLPTAPAANEDRESDVGGADGVVAHYVGDVSRRSGLSGLEAIDEVTMVAAPDLMAAYQRGDLSREQAKAVQMAMINHCENMANRMAIIDPLPDLSPAEVHDWRQIQAGFDSKFAALYYPWIKVADPSNGKTFMMPPSGHVAGLWARNDEARGVHKAPANEVLRGALDLGIQITKGEQERLNPAGINCIRSFPGRGIRVWGARTLSSDSAWRYLNVRRLFNYLEESIFQGSQWVVFEPNDERLWATIRRNVAAFLVGEWRQGALFGATPDEAFYVKCDGETNPPEVIDAGQVVCEIGVAPVKPAEFVVFRISQESPGGAGAVE